MRRLFFQYSVVGILAYAGLCAWLYFAQDGMLYFPTPEVTVRNADVVTLQSGEDTLKVWKLGSGRDAVLYFGGNGENVANNIEHLDGLLADTTFYLLNYRGYGGSSGKPNEAAFKQDAARLYDQVSSSHRRVSVIGRSLGSGVATWLAANRPVYKVILVTPYDSIEDVASNAYPYAPVSLLLRDKFRSVDDAPSIRVPVLVLLADTDTVIPHHHTMNLVDKLRAAQVSVRTLLNSTHNSISRAEDYYTLIRQFLIQELQDSMERDAA